MFSEPWEYPCKIIPRQTFDIRFSNILFTVQQIIVMNHVRIALESYLFDFNTVQIFRYFISLKLCLAFIRLEYIQNVCSINSIRNNFFWHKILHTNRKLQSNWIDIDYKMEICLLQMLKNKARTLMDAVMHCQLIRT